MLNTLTFSSKPSHVRVTFDDGSHDFRLSKYATLVELASFIDLLGTHHNTAPRSIEVSIPVTEQGAVSKGYKIFP